MRSGMPAGAAPGVVPARVAVLGAECDAVSGAIVGVGTQAAVAATIRSRATREYTDMMNADAC